jgi:hypothetical protein
MTTFNINTVFRGNPRSNTFTFIAANPGQRSDHGPLAFTFARRSAYRRRHRQMLAPRINVFSLVGATEATADARQGRNHSRGSVRDSPAHRGRPTTRTEIDCLMTRSFRLGALPLKKSRSHFRKRTEFRSFELSFFGNHFANILATPKSCKY